LNLSQFLSLSLIPKQLVLFEKKTRVTQGSARTSVFASANVHARLVRNKQRCVARKNGCGAKVKKKKVRQVSSAQRNSAIDENITPKAA